jgi:branched-chain amino acid transport system substrate-binding protein
MFRRLAVTFGAAASIFAADPVRAENGVENDKILLGGSNALTGAVAANCAPATYGAKGWFDKINKEGGVHGRRIEYNVLDDAYSPQRAIGNVRKLIDQDKVFGIFGGCATATSAAILSFLADLPDVPYLFTWAGMNELVQPTKKSVFALLPNYVFQLEAALPFALQRMSVKPKTAGILAMNIPGVEDLRATARKIFASNGVDIVYDDIFEVTVPDRSPYILQLKARNPDMLLVSDAAAGAARIFLDMKRQNWKPAHIFGVATLTAEQFLDPVGTFADDILTAAGMVVPPTAPEAQPCNDALKASYPNVKPSHFTMFGCLAAIIAIEAFNRAGKDLTRQRFVDALNNMREFKTGVSGPISFSPDDHMGVHSIIPFGVKDGQFVVLGAPLTPAK